MKLVLALALFTAFVIFAVMLTAQLSGVSLSRMGRIHSLPVLAMTSLVLATMIALVQVGALGLLRLLPWQGPTLKVERDDDLRRVFE